MSGEGRHVRTLLQFVRFGAVGIVNTLIGFATILLLRFGLGTSDVAANIAGYIVGIAVSYVLNRRFTFADRGPMAASLARFAISAVAAYGVNLAVLLLALHVLEIGSLASQISAMIAYSTVFFLLAKLFAFRAGNERRPREAEMPRA